MIFLFFHFFSSFFLLLVDFFFFLWLWILLFFCLFVCLSFDSYSHANHSSHLTWVRRLQRPWDQCYPVLPAWGLFRVLICCVLMGISQWPNQGSWGKFCCFDFQLLTRSRVTSSSVQTGQLCNRSVCSHGAVDLGVGVGGDITAWDSMFLDILMQKANRLAWGCVSAV